MHERLPLYDPTAFRDACGVGFIADRSAERSHRLTRLAVNCLHNLDHRGAKSADGTGDGAGMMTRIPHRILARDLTAAGITAPEYGRLGVMMTFLPRDDTDGCRKDVELAVAEAGLDFLIWRQVPVGPMALSEAARASMPVIEQALVAAHRRRGQPRRLRASALPRQKARTRATPSKGSGFFVASSSCRTIVYKGLFTASHIEKFYWDLGDPTFETDFAIFHQRYSTNTEPAWALAQPFRMLGHNGEINTVQANRSWMAARSQDLSNAVWGDRTAELKPLVVAAGQRFGESRQCASRCWSAPGGRCRPRQGDADPGGLGERAGSRRRSPRLLRVPRLPDRAMGRACRHRGLRRAPRRRRSRPQRAAARTMDGHARRRDRCLRSGHCARPTRCRRERTGQLGPGEIIRVDLVDG